MKYLSVFSGIEAASCAWHPLGWTPVAFAETDPFACAVLRARYPDVPNWGDMTKFKEWPDADVDVLVGGTPCQSFSVAGLRKGLLDPRGNLTLTFLAIADRYHPEFVVWENVPGILSDNTQALHGFLDGLEELGYVVDVDILDAQFFGVAQRRRRLFVCGQRASSILNQRTLTSALTIVQCLAESLLLCLVALSDRSTVVSENCTFDVTAPVLSLQKRMRLFGWDSSSAGAAERLAANLGVLLSSSATVPNGSGSANGNANCAPIGATRSAGSSATVASAAECRSTEMSLSESLDAALKTLSECITSISTSATTAPTIFSCATALLRIVAPITQSMDSSPSFWSAASSGLTATEAFITYARSASSDLFTEPEWIQPWCDFLREAVPVRDALQRLRVQSSGKVLPIAEGLSWDPPPSREARERAAPCLEARAAAGGGGWGTDFLAGGGLADVAAGIRASASPRGHGNSSGLRGDGSDNLVPEIAGTFWDGGQVSQTLDAVLAKGQMMPEKNRFPAVLVPLAFSCKDSGADSGEDVAPTLRSLSEDKGNANAGGQVAVAFKPSHFTRGKDGQPAETTPPLSADADKGDQDTLIAGPLPFDTTQVTHPANHSAPKSGDPCHPLAKGAHAPAVAIRTANTQANGHGVAEEAAHTLDGAQGQAVAYDSQNVALTGDKVGAMSGCDSGNRMPHVLEQQPFAEVADPVAANQARTYTREGNFRVSNVAHSSMQVRRLTPVECCRLQGFPDDYLDVPYHGKPAADGPKYKSLGNSFAVPVIGWIGRRIQMVEGLTEDGGPT